MTIHLKRDEDFETFSRLLSDVIWASEVEQIVQVGDRIAHTYGLAGMDALHIAAALSVDAKEFVTTENLTKPMHRVTEIQVISIAS